MSTRRQAGGFAVRYGAGFLGLAALSLAVASPDPGAPAPRGARPQPAAPIDVPRQEDTLRLASWNIAWLAARDREGAVPRSESDYARLRRYAERLDPDVVGLQELEGVAAARRVFDPDRYAFAFAAGGGSTQRAGFAWKRSLRVTRHPDVAALGLGGRSRAGADITVHADRGDLRLLSIHLKAGCPGGRLDADDTACRLLAEQGRVLEAWIDARAREGAVFAVLGDFNRRFSSRDAFWTDLDDSDPPEADLLDAGFGRRPPCWNGRYTQYIDHIVLSRTAAGWLVPGSFVQSVYDPADASWEAVLSDHCPIAIRLRTGRVSTGLDPPPPQAKAGSSSPR